MKSTRVAFTVLGIGSLSTFLFVGCSSGPKPADPAPQNAVVSQPPPGDPPPPAPSATQDPPGAQLDPARAGRPVPPAPFDLQGFLDQQATAVCMRLSGCCGGAFDVARCTKLATSSGWEYSNAEITPAIVQNGNLQLNIASAQKCIADLAGLSCPMLGSSEMLQVTADCYDAVVGTVAQGGACQASIECTPGLYCDLDTTKQCQPLVQSGSACGQGAYASSFSSDECAYKGWPSTSPSYCNYDSYPDPTRYACTALRAAGDTCYSNNECSTGVCGGANDCSSGSCTCVSTRDLSNFCTAFALPQDAGAD